MEKIKFGIGFVTGRKNVCNIINTYYKNILEQLGKEVELTFFILYDLNYNKTAKEDFYRIDQEVYESGVIIKHIGEEEINIEKGIVQDKYNFTEEEVNLILGHGYAKARNTIMYYALKSKMDYLLFWDDDEYPVACINENGKITWKEQLDIAEHMKYIKEADITVGHHCGYISPIPYIDFDKSVSEEDFKNYIDAVSNEAVYWEKIKNTIKQNGITYAEKDIVEGKKVTQLHRLGVDQWLPGTGICLKLKDMEKIPAFYNPPKARGEDTFFSTLLSGTKVYKIPTYHFHDGFLKYTNIMQKDYPTQLGKIKIEDQKIEKRFLDASIGWIKYKPLLLYITHKQNYREIIGKTYQKLEACIPKMNNVFTHYDCNCLLEELSEYDSKVEEHYREYIRTNNIWNRLKQKVN